LPVNLVKGFAEGNTSGNEVFGGLPVSPLIIHTVKVDGVPLKFQSRLLAGGNCLLPNMRDVFGRVAADEDFLAVTEVAAFGNEFVNFRISYGAQFLIVCFAHFWAYSFEISIHSFITSIL
jgi:hypothetical protein